MLGLVGPRCRPIRSSGCGSASCSERRGRRNGEAPAIEPPICRPPSIPSIEAMRPPRWIRTTSSAAGWLAGLFLIAIFLLMMGLSAGRQFGINIPAGDEFAVVVHGGDGVPRPRAHIQIGRDDPRRADHRALQRPHPAGVRDRRAGNRLAFTGFFTWHASKFTYYSWLTNEVAQGVVPMPMWIPQLGYCAGLALLTVAIFDELVHVLAGSSRATRRNRRRRPKRSSSAPSQSAV